MYAPRCARGAGNTGQLDNVALSLEGEAIPALPGLAYNLGLLSRGPGKDGTRREWAWAAGLHYEHAWTEEIRTLAFGEFVEFRNAEGGPLEQDENGTERPVSERRRFFHAGDPAPDRRLAGNLRLAARRSQAVLQYPADAELVGAPGGRELGWGLGLDIGYQYARFVPDDRSLGQSHSIVGRLK